MLVDKFGLRPWEIARLSERYINDVYFYARDEHGCLVQPVKPVTAADFGTRYDPPASLEEELRTLKDLNAAVFNASNKTRGLANYLDMESRIRAKWADGSRAKAYEEWKAANGRRDAADADT